MSSSRWDPWNDFVSLREAMNNLLEESIVTRQRQPGDEGPRAVSAAAQAPASGLALDIRETPDAFEVTASVPGVSPDQVDITVLGDRLRIKGERTEPAANKAADSRWVLRERRFGAFERTVNLPALIKPDDATAHFKQGVLTIMLPKADQARPRSIPVQPGDPSQQQPSGFALDPQPEITNQQIILDSQKKSDPSPSGPDTSS